jgi:hypothetical protein
MDLSEATEIIIRLEQKSRRTYRIPAMTISSTQRSRQRPGGFVLWEVMLALTIFCVVAVALTSALHQTVDVSIMLRDESQVRIELQNILTETAMQKLKVGKSDMQVGDGRIQYEREIRAVIAKTAKGVPVPNLYEVVARAFWRSAGQDRTNQARVIIYQP